MNNTSHSECEVCGCVISHVDALLNKHSKNSVCRSFDCQRVMSQKSSMTPFLFQSIFEFDKKLIRQRREKGVAKKKHTDEITEKIQQENDSILQSILDEHTELSEQDVRLLDIPSGYSKLTSINKARVDKYIKNVTAFIDEAVNYSCASEVVYDQHHDAHDKLKLVEERFDVSPVLRNVSDKLCGICKGGCCAKGDEHAYLSVFTMRQMLDDNPELTTELLRERYLSHIGSETIENSCINHSKTGCALPRELRSAICNGFYCDTLKDYQKTMVGKDDSCVLLVVQRACTNWNRFEPHISHAVVNTALINS
jgi:hypothetical protein